MTPIQDVSSQPVEFTPDGASVTCNAFSATFKGLATLFVTAAVIWAWRLYDTGNLSPTLQSAGWISAALIMMAYTQWHILIGKTTLDSKALQQTWVWRKHVELQDLAYAKLIRVRGLDWLIAPRLYTKTFSGKLSVFYASHSVMLTEFQRLEQHIHTQRNDKATSFL